MITHFAYAIVFGESVIVEDGEHQCLVEGVRVGNVLEQERFVEEWVEGLSVDLGLKLLQALGLGDEEDLKWLD